MRPVTRALLAGSLLLNLFAAGAIGGGLVALHRARTGHARVFALAPRPIREAGDALAPMERLRFRAAMRATLMGSSDLSRLARESRMEAAALFTAPTFDAGAVEAALARARAADVELRARLETEAVMFASSLPTQERVALAEGLSHGGPLRHPKRLATRPTP